MKKQLLSGTWNYRIGKGKWEKKDVPFSVLAVGHSECERKFDLEESGDRVFLRFDGINYHAKVTLNGKLLGEMVAYCEYTFDITDIVLEKDNVLLVELEDLSPEFGPSEGWENNGGITRDVCLLYANKAYISDVYFKSNFKNGYKDAEYTAEITCDGECDATCRVALSYGDKTVDAYTVKTGEDAPVREVSDVHLWSPETPSLYTLLVELCVDGEVVDTYECNVGFREFKCNRHRFLLNGEEIFLQGVCKHEMYGDYVHTVPEEVIEKDLRMIKETGCNFVRLVHYPHNKITLDIADRIGIMVSEEPGLWWSDTANPAVSGGSLEVLRRTVRRDRNHASIVFWLCFNECRFTEQYLVDAARVCRENDSTRLVSGANCMSNEDTLKYYNICNFDFYTMHPYSRRIDRSIESAKVLHDKPLMFTEWGGYYVYDNPHLITDFINAMYNLYLQNSDEGALAGASFWYWAEVKDFGRGLPACVDGDLREALVDKNRNPSMIYKYFCDAWKNARIITDDKERYEYIPLDMLDKTPLCCNDKTDKNKLLEIANTVVDERFWRMRKRSVTVGPVLQREEVSGISKVPHLLTKEKTLSFGGGVTADTLTLLGAVSLGKGYPTAGEYGEAVAKLTVKHADGKIEEHVLKNGVDVTTAFMSIGSSRINPVAENATRFAIFSYEKNFENYCINRLDIKLEKQTEIESVELSALADGYSLLVYGMLA